MDSIKLIRMLMANLCFVKCFEFSFESGGPRLAGGHIFESAVLELVAFSDRLPALVPLLCHCRILSLG